MNTTDYKNIKAGFLRVGTLINTLSFRIEYHVGYPTVARSGIRIPILTFVRMTKVGKKIGSILFLLLFLFPLSPPAFAANSSIFTAELWVKPETSIATKALVGKAEELRVFTDASGYVGCQIKATTWQTAAQATTTALPLNSWSHVACTYDKITIRVYVNGVQVATQAETDAVDDTANALKIGQDDSSGTTYTNLQGTTDDFRFYNYARSTKQIVSDLNAGHPAVGSPVGSAVAHYKFDEGQGTVAKNYGSGGSTLNGTLTNMSAPATSTSGWTNDGKFSKALNFDGSDDYVSTSFSKSSGDGAISLWFKMGTQTNSVSSTIRPLVSQGDWNGAASGIGITTFSNDNANAGKIKAVWGIDNGSDQIITPIYNDSRWHNVIVTKERTTATVYIDGIKIGSQLSSDSVNTSTNFLIGGTTTGYSERKFNGAIDEVKIYNYALSEDEVKLDYNQGKAIVMGNLGTTSSGTAASNAASRGYCPPGNVEGNCAAGLNPAPVGEWNFDDPSTSSGQAAVDTSGNNNSGQLGSTSGVDASDPTWTNGKVGKGLSFDGSDDEITTTADIDAGSGNGISVSAWVKFSACTGNINWCYLVSKADSLATAPYLLFTNSSGTLMFGAQGVQANSAGGFNDNAWHFVYGTINNTDARLYVDGRYVASATVTAASNNEYVTIGSDDSNSAFRPYKGSIDQVKIYNYARTPAQIAWDYNKGLPAIHYKFNECSGTTINNSVPNANEEESGNNGTLTIGASGTNTSAGTCSSGSSAQAWNNGASGAFNSSIDLDGTDDYVTTGDTNINIYSVSVWIRPSSTTQSIIDLDGGTHTLTVSSGTISAGGFSSPTIYVDGKVSSTLPDTNWHMITVTTATAFEASNLVLGKISSNYFNGRLDEFKMFTYPLTREQVKLQYNDASAVKFKAEDTEKWWLAGGVDEANAIAVYQPKGAASLADSYDNLAAPANGLADGTYDAAPGVAPTWASGTGWAFNGSTTQLTTGVVPDATGWSLLVGVEATGGGGGGAGRAIDNNNVGFGVAPWASWVANGPIFLLSSQVTTFEIVGFAAKTVYRDGINVGTIGAGNAPALPIYIGNNSAGNRGLLGRITAIAIYNTTLTADQVAKITAKMQAL